MFRAFLMMSTFHTFVYITVLFAYVCSTSLQSSYNIEQKLSVTDINNTTVHKTQEESNRKFADRLKYLGPCQQASTKKVEHVTDSEIEDLTKKSTISVHTTTTKVQLEATTSPPPLSSSDTKSSVDRLIQPEARLHTNSRFNMTTGGIAVLICATVAVVFYAGIMIWKRISINAYLNREILLNDDDSVGINDENMRHFEAACIQIEA